MGCHMVQHGYGIRTMGNGVVVGCWVVCTSSESTLPLLAVSIHHVDMLGAWVGCQGGVRGLERPNLPVRGKVRKDVRTVHFWWLEGPDPFGGARSTSAPAPSAGDGRGGAIHPR